MRLIDADKLHYNRIRIFHDDGTVGGYNAVVMSAEIKDAPAVDARPVVRGRWKNAIKSCNDSPHVKCSVCGEYYWRYFNKFNFCPNCGADMREES